MYTCEELRNVFYEFLPTPLTLSHYFAQSLAISKFIVKK